MDGDHVASRRRGLLSDARLQRNAAARSSSHVNSAKPNGTILAQDQGRNLVQKLSCGWYANPLAAMKETRKIDRIDRLLKFRPAVYAHDLAGDPACGV